MMDTVVASVQQCKVLTDETFSKVILLFMATLAVPSVSSSTRSLLNAASTTATDFRPNKKDLLASWYDVYCTHRFVHLVFFSVSVYCVSLPVEGAYSKISKAKQSKEKTPCKGSIHVVLFLLCCSQLTLLLVCFLCSQPFLPKDEVWHANWASPLAGRRVNIVCRWHLPAEIVFRPAFFDCRL